MRVATAIKLKRLRINYAFAQGPGWRQYVQMQELLTKSKEMWTLAALTPLMG